MGRLNDKDMIKRIPTTQKIDVVKLIKIRVTLKCFISFLGIIH